MGFNSIDLSAYSAKASGITLIKDTDVTIDSGSSLTTLTADLSSLTSSAMSVILIYSPAAAINYGDDLDSNDDGELDLPDKAIIIDNFGWHETPYSDVTVHETYAVHGATRYKDNRICATSSWTYGELNGTAYIEGRAKFIPKNALITPGNVNITKETSMLVKPSVETARSTISSPDADDVALWIHPTDASKSMVIATQKNAGYSVYDSAGATLIDALPGDNRYNNVDVMYNFDLNGELIDIAVFSDRNNNKFAIYKIQETAPYIVDITDQDSDELFDAKELGEDTAYGEGVYKSPITGKFYAFATQNDTWNVAQFELMANRSTIGWIKVRNITLEADDDDKHAEGIVVDQEYGKAYIAQEEVGIYTLDAEPGPDPVDITLDESDLLIKEGDHDMVEDLEGMAIYYKDNGEGYVFISSQGNSSYGVFDRTDVGSDNSFITSFAVVDDMNGIDGTQHTDSLDVTNIGISDLFPNGAFIVQDGTDTETDPDDVGTNFKWIKWEDIAMGLGDISFASAYDPRTPLNRR
jgi:myo-inositol-hexaphosphate 3-phosphohydrolase